MVNHSVIGQLDLFLTDDYKNTAVVSGFDCGLSISDTSTRTKASLRPRITKQVLDAVAIKLTTLEPVS